MSSKENGNSKALRPCVVIWDDAHQDCEDHKIASLADTKGVRTRTIGWFVCENDFGITLSSDQWPDSEDHKDYIKSRGFIPWGMVVDWYYIDVN